MYNKDDTQSRIVAIYVRDLEEWEQERSIQIDVILIMFWCSPTPNALALVSQDAFLFGHKAFADVIF